MAKTKRITLHARPSLARRLPWRRILVPIDFSALALRALEVAVPLARDGGARIFLLTAIEPVTYAGGMEAVIIATPEATLVKAAKAQLSKIAKRLIPPSIAVTTMVEQGHAFKVITQVAKAKRIDLIVLTTHGRSGFDRFMMGGTAERVVRHAHCQVYVARNVHQTPKNHQKRKD